MNALIRSDSCMSSIRNLQTGIDDNSYEPIDRNNFFNLSKETEAEYFNFIKEEILFQDKIKLLRLLKSITNSSEVFQKHKILLKDFNNKRAIGLKKLIDKLVNELNLFSNKLILYPDYQYLQGDYDKINDIKRFIDLYKKQIIDNNKTYDI